MKKTILTYCFIYFFTCQAISQLPDHHVRMLPQKPGLVYPSQVEEMIKDTKGFLWFLTPTMVQRFDGKNILSFSFDDRCLSIQQDENGTVFLASRQNIYRYKNDHTGFEKLQAYTDSTVRYLRLHTGPQKKLYLLTNKGILKWIPVAGKFEATGVPAFRNEGNFTFLKSFGNCIFYRLNTHTLARYNVISNAQDSVQVMDPNYLVAINEDSVWVRQGIGSSVLVSFPERSITSITASQFTGSFNDNNFFITGGFPVRTGEIFVVLNYKGYYSYNPEKKVFKKINLFHAGRPLDGKPIISNNAFYKESDGTAWFVNEEGFFYLNFVVPSIGLFRSKTADNPQHWNDDIRNFTEDDQGNIWFGTADGFCKWDQTSGLVTTWKPDFTAEHYLNYPSIKGLGFSHGKIIIGQSEKGFWIYDPAKQTFNRPSFTADSLQQRFQKEFNRNMLKLRNGNFLIISNGAWLLEKETFRITPLPRIDAFFAARSAYEDGQGRIWIMGRNGIAVTDQHFKLLYHLQDEIRGRWYNGVVQIDDSTYWVAARVLYEVKLKPQQQLVVRPIFPELRNVHFSSLFKDSIGNIWMGSNDGIYRFIPEKKILEKFDRGDNVYNFYEGISNHFRSRNGTAYFGSLHGINYFVPEKIPQQNDSLVVHLLNVTVNGDDSSFLLRGSLPNLSHSQNNLYFDFITPYLHNAEKVQYRYKLEGVDNNWVNLGNNTTVNFNSLQPGNYTFTVAASVNGTDWYDLKTPFSFSIEPPFWKTWWFISLFLITVIALAFLLIKRRISFIKKREAEKTELQKIKAASYQARLEAEQVINYFATSISGQNTVEEMLWDVAKNLIGKLGFEDCMIYLWNKDKTVLMQRAGYGIKGSMQSEPDKNIYNVPKGKGIVGAAVENRHYILANDTALDKRYFSVDEKVRLSELCVPIIHNNEAMGAINTEHSAKNFYTDRHLQILTTIASMLADKIDTIEAQQQTREKEIEVLKLHKDFATSQLTALRTQMNPHFIFNALNSIQQYILQGNISEANKYLSKFSKLQREILHCSNQHFISLEKEIEILTSYLQLEQLRFGESFTYQINMTDDIEPVVINIPPMILQPFVENAIWHGLMPRQTGRILSIYFDLYSDDILMATIRDNGIGRTASALLKKNNNGPAKTVHESKGMSMVQQRLNLLQQQYDKPFDAAISDIIDENGLVQGTQVTLKIFIGNTQP